MALAIVMTMPLMLPTSISQATAASGDRTLYLYYTHTKETAKITFRRGGRYDSKGLAELNKFLRDWRRNEPTKMDPALFDLIWEVYKESGATKPIHVVSAYRSPATNAALRSKSRGVAKNSRHTQGMAMDFYIPGVSIAKLRRIAMSKQVGGVGYYPTSGNPFVHLDTGNVRAWPRMTRAQLQKVFPDGKTLHVPTDGVPISKSGYAYAKAEWTRCKTVPCNGRSTSRTTTRVADSGDKPAPGTSAGNGGTILGWLFGDGESDDQSQTVSVATVTATTNNRSNPRVTTAPIPMTRSTGITGDQTVIQVANAPAPAPRPAVLDIEAAPQPHLFNGDQGTIAVASVDAPQPRALFSNSDESQSPLLTAYAPAIVPEPDAQRAVQMLIERQLAEDAAPQTAAAPATFEIASDPVRTASLAGGVSLNSLGDLIEGTWNSVSRAGEPAPKQLPTNVVSSTIELKRGRLHAPDLDHVTEIFVDPQPVYGARYAVIFEHDQADFDPATELGYLSDRAQFSVEPAWGLESNRFASRAPIRVALR